MSRFESLQELNQFLKSVENKGDSDIIHYLDEEEIYSSELQNKRYTKTQYYAMLSQVPLRQSVLVAEDRLNNRTFLVDMKVPEIKTFVTTHKNQIYRLIDYLLHYMILEDLNELFIGDKVHAKKRGSETLTRIPRLETYATENMKVQLRKEVIEMSSNLHDISEMELNTNIQGLDSRIVVWENRLTKELEVLIKTINIKDDIPKQSSNLFKAEKGFIMFNRMYSRYLNSLLNVDTEYKRIAYIDMLNLVSLRDDGYHFSLETQTIGEITNKDFEIYVINAAKIKDIDEILDLPSNRLVIFVIPADTNLKALNYLKVFNEDLIVKNHVIDNLTSFAIELDRPVIIAPWSRELLKSENPDIEDLMEKLETPFNIRENDLNINEIDILEEIKLMLLNAEIVGSDEIGIVPGSYIRFYQNKIDYLEYPTVIKEEDIAKKEKETGWEYSPAVKEMLPVFYNPVNKKIKMTPNLVEVMIMNMISASEIKQLKIKGELDTSYSVPGVGRFRLGIVTQRSSLAMSIRKVNASINKSKLNLPKNFIEDLVKLDKGITLVVGEPNSGKTTTFNEIIDQVNEKRGGILFLMGNPIERIHNHKKALVIQIEVGKDLPSYTHGIAKSLRMNTTTLGFEELRTQEEFAALGAILNAPNSIFMTGHAASVRQAIQNLVSRVHETGVSESKALEDIANALNYVFYQKLIDCNGKRVMIYEKLKATPQIKALIRNGNFNQLNSAVLSDKECESMDSVILQRIEEGLLTFDSVKNFITDKARFEMKGYKF